MVTSNKKADKPCPLWTGKQKLGLLVQVLKLPGDSPFSGLQTAAFLLCLPKRPGGTRPPSLRGKNSCWGERVVEQL